VAESSAAPSGGGRRLTRKQALIGGGVLVAGGGTAAGVILATKGGGGGAPSYPRASIAKLSSVQPNQPISFDYPLKGQGNVLLDLDHAVPEGVGPKQSLVAYSVFCQHMGCPVVYQPSLREFVCPCHQTRYDPERLGSIVQGVAMLPLPRVLLEVKNDSVDAVGIDGLIYGYRDNLHPGESVGGKA
jgi:arsenite oxidase small subunit